MARHHSEDRHPPRARARAPEPCRARSRCVPGHSRRIRRPGGGESGARPRRLRCRGKRPAARSACRAGAVPERRRHGGRTGRDADEPVRCLQGDRVGSGRQLTRAARGRGQGRRDRIHRHLERLGRLRGGRRHGERHRRRPERQHRVSLASACRRPRGWHERLGLVRWQRGDGPGLPRCARRHPARLHGAARHHDCRGSDRTGSAGGGAGSSGEYGDELHRRRRDDVRNQYARRSPVRHEDGRRGRRRRDVRGSLGR